MRKQIRPGLDGDDFTHEGYSKPAGTLIIPAHRNDLKVWFDGHTFGYDMKKSDPIQFVVKHTKCPLPYNLVVKYSTDRPKHMVTCPLCFKRWELHQLEKMLPNDFAETFEYLWIPKEPWPYEIANFSNGVSKYTGTVYADIRVAAEYYYKEFIAFKNNGFKWSQQ